MHVSAATRVAASCGTVRHRAAHLPHRSGSPFVDRRLEQIRVDISLYSVFIASATAKRNGLSRGEQSDQSGNNRPGATAVSERLLRFYMAPTPSSSRYPAARQPAPIGIVALQTTSSREPLRSKGGSCRGSVKSETPFCHAFGQRACPLMLSATPPDFVYNSSPVDFDKMPSFTTSRPPRAAAARLPRWRSARPPHARDRRRYLRSRVVIAKRWSPEGELPTLVVRILSALVTFVLLSRRFVAGLILSSQPLGNSFDVCDEIDLRLYHY